MPTAWALEDLLAKNNERDEWQRNGEDSKTYVQYYRERLKQVVLRGVVFAGNLTKLRPPVHILPLILYHAPIHL
jgi:hypothetical protein